MDDAIRDALDFSPAASAWDRTIEITTTGARSGLPRRIEIWFYRAGDTHYLSGLPSPTPDWYRNIEANPEFLFHLKHGAQATLKAVGRPVTDEAERRRVFTEIVADLNQPANPGKLARPTTVQEWVDGSVLVEISFGD